MNEKDLGMQSTVGRMFSGEGQDEQFGFFLSTKRRQWSILSRMALFDSHL